MYPQINLAGGFTNPAPIQTTAPPGSASFGGPGSPVELSTTTLRVVVAEQFRVAPPVPAPPSASAGPAGPAVPAPATAGDAGGPESDAAAVPIDFSYEKKVLAELEGGGKAGDDGEAGPQRQDRFEALASQCMSAGSHSREEAALALAVALSTAGHRADGAAVAQAAASLKHLVSMGFSKQDAVGALVAKGGDLTAAVDMLTS